MNISNLSNLIEVATSTSNEANYIQSKILDLAFSGSFLPKEIPGPDTWETLRLDEVCEYIQRGKSPKYDEKGEVRVVSQKCVQWSGFNPEHARYIENSTIEKYTQDRFLRDSDILWNSTGSGTVGRTCIFSSHNDQRKYVADSHVTVLRSTRVFPKFLLYWTRSPKIQDRVLGLTTGSTNQQELNLSTIKSLEISIPDLKYQVLLANHIDVLITLYEKLDICMKASQEVLSKARKSSIDAISTAQTPEELQNSWERIQRNWEVVAESSESIGDLRALILNLAVKGRLTSRMTKYNSAAKELASVEKAEVRELFNGTDSESDVYPKGWAVASFPNIGQWVAGSGFPTDEQGHTDKEILFCKVSDMNLPANSRHLVEANNTIDSATAKKLRATILKEGTVVFPKIGGAIATNKRRLIVKPTIVDNNCMGITPCSVIDSEWLFILLSSIDFVKYQSGTSIPSISQRTLDQIEFGVPPLNEQKMIVEKVSQLMKICDELENRILEKDNIAENFAKSIVAASA